MNKPILSVVMITYGHENYIKQAIESVYIQKTDFPIEFIISNDASPDNTTLIINDLLKNCPDNITVSYTEQKNNLGMMSNFIWAFEHAQGKYIAYFEGDDYWTDPLKLQKQVNFLEANNDFNICFHNVQVLENDVLVDYISNKNENTIYHFSDLVQNNFIASLSGVYRNSNEPLPIWFSKMPIGDYPFHLLHSQNGKIYQIAENMGVYRKGVGVWSSQSNIDILKKTSETIEMIYHNISMNIQDQTEIVKQYSRLQNLIIQLKFPNILLHSDNVDKKTKLQILKKQIICYCKNLLYIRR